MREQIVLIAGACALMVACRKAPVSAHLPLAGSHKTSIGIFSPATRAFYLKDALSDGTMDSIIQFGDRDDIAIAGRWSGDGVTRVGVFRPSEATFYLLDDNRTGAPVITVTFGVDGDLPIAGDWDGDGKDTIGVYRRSNATFYLRNSNTTGSPDLTIRLGTPGGRQIPVAGAFSDPHRSSVGLYIPEQSVFQLLPSLTAKAAMTFAYGSAGGDYVPVTGDWDHDGVDTVGLYVPPDSQFLLRNKNATGIADMTVTLRAPTGRPLSGSWR